jgi:hypothetical protein
MSVRLVATGAAAPGHEVWASVDGEAPQLDPARRMPELGRQLEEAFEAVAEEWWSLGRLLAREKSAALAHASACASNASDLGQMLAWSRLVERWGGEACQVLVVCRDPWMFRHLATLPGVTAGPAPSVLKPSLKLAVRGVLSRGAVALRMARAALSLRGQRATSQGGAHLLVYGHPASNAQGDDAYFGPLMRELPALGRLLHVDCSAARACELAADGRTRSLHAWGSPLFALGLAFARWRPRLGAVPANRRWLVRRAAALEGGTGMAAAIRWQLHCQQRWLKAVAPKAVAWPWENHSWERAFVRSARPLGSALIGYQHSVIGRQMFNYALHANADGAASAPDRVLCTGQATLRQLADWGMPAERLAVGGALRFAQPLAIRHDPAAPVFMALPFDQMVAAEMVEAARAAAAQGWRFLVRDHPMTPFAFAESDGVSRAPGPLSQQQAVAAVVFAATTVGLEALLAGLPVLRFRPASRISIDILPAGLSVPVAEAATLSEALARAAAPTPPARDHIFAGADLALWHSLFS